MNEKEKYQEDIIIPFKEAAADIYFMITGVNRGYNDAEVMRFTHSILENISDDDKTDKYYEFFKLNNIYDIKAKEEKLQDMAEHAAEHIVRAYSEMVGFYEDDDSKILPHVYDMFKPFLESICCSDNTEFYKHDTESKHVCSLMLGILKKKSMEGKNDENM